MKKILIVILTLSIIFILTSCNEKMETTTKIAIFETNQGMIEIELFTEQMPITTSNFIKLAESGFYNNVKFHRIIEGFMIQGGDPLTKDETKKNFWGTGGPGYTIEDEFCQISTNTRGTISMANAGPNTGGSQFFINLVDNTFLDSKHPVFGKVVKGMEIVDKIGKVETDNSDRPLEAVIIEKIIIK